MKAGQTWPLLKLQSVGSWDFDFQMKWPYRPFRLKCEGEGRCFLDFFSSKDKWAGAGLGLVGEWNETIKSKSYNAKSNNLLLEPTLHARHSKTTLQLLTAISF